MFPTVKMPGPDERVELARGDDGPQVRLLTDGQNVLNEEDGQVVKLAEFTNEISKSEVAKASAIPTESIDSSANAKVAFVSTVAPNPAPADGDFSQEVVQLGSPATSAPVVAAVTQNNTLTIVLVPLACSVLIFFLMWSVVNGWFERLIF